MAERGTTSSNDQRISLSETIQKQGWLMKRSRMSKRWNKQWCCLKKNELLYGNSDEETPKIISLEGCEMTDCTVDKKLYAFRIKPRGSNRVYFFHTETQQDQQEWMQAICFAKATGNIGEDGSQACTIQ